MSPRTKKQNEAQKELTRKKILDTAFDLFAKNTYHATSIEAIAKQANISKGLLYNYFDSKEKLLEEIINMMMEEGDKFYADIADPDPRKMLENVIRFFFREIRESRDRWRLLTILSLQNEVYPFVSQVGQEKMAVYNDIFGKILKQIGYPSPEMEGRLLGILFDGIGVQSMILGEGYPYEALEEYFITKYCKHGM